MNVSTKTDQLKKRVFRNDCESATDDVEDVTGTTTQLEQLKLSSASSTDETTLSPKRRRGADDDDDNAGNDDDDESKADDNVNVNGVDEGAEVVNETDVRELELALDQMISFDKKSANRSFMPYVV